MKAKKFKERGAWAAVDINGNVIDVYREMKLKDAKKFCKYWYENCHIERVKIVRVEN